MKEPLSLEERNWLRDCEAVIERSLETFYEVGTALLKIRDERLYRTSHKTFDQYCQKRWGWHRRRADRLIEAAEVVKHLGEPNLSPTGLKTEPAILPDNERQARELASLPAEEQRAAWSEAVEESQGGQPTAEVVATAARRHAPCRISPQRSTRLSRKPDATLEHHQHLTAIMLSIEELAEPKIDISQASREILMADRGRRYETQARQAQQTLGRLLDAMRRIA